jgi:HK97 gp10 family phage protein
VATTTRTRVKVNRAEVKKLARHPKVQAKAEGTAQAVAQVAQQIANSTQRGTGAGAASIHGEQQPDGTWRVTWDRDHYYMQFPEFGTVNQPPNPFLRPAAARFK